MDETITINGKEYTKEDVEKAKKTIVNAWETYCKIVSEIVNNIIKVIRQFILEIREYQEKSKHDYNWHVPIKITPPPMPDLKLPKLHYARSNL